MSRHPQITKALERVRTDQAIARAHVEAAFPIGSLVMVTHYRGQFQGTVIRIGGQYGPHDLGYVSVQNKVTLKTSKRHYEDLERLP